MNQEGMVGKAGFEPAISRSRTERDTRLRYFPNDGQRIASVPNRVHWCDMPKILRGPVCQLVTKLVTERGSVLRLLIVRYTAKLTLLSRLLVGSGEYRYRHAPPIRR